MVVYELYGCPGSGKSTVTREAIKALRAGQVSCLSYDDVYSRGQHGKLRKLLRFAMALADPAGFPLLKEVIRACRALGSQPKYGLYLLTLCRQLRQAEKRGNGIVLLDEGVIQLITSLAHRRPIEGYQHLSALVENVKRCGAPVKAVRCELPLTMNMERFRARGETKRTRFLNARDDAELASLLQLKWDNLQAVARYFPQVCALDMRVAMENNVEALCQVVEEII